MHLQHIMLPTLLLFTASAISSVIIISRRDTGASIWNSIKGNFEPSAQELWDSVTGPTYKDIAQGNTGDCWLEASMAAIAYADKNRIKIFMIDLKNDEGTVSVTLYNGSTPGTYEITKRTIISSNSDEDTYCVPAGWAKATVLPEQLSRTLADMTFVLCLKLYCKALPAPYGTWRCLMRTSYK